MTQDIPDSVLEDIICKAFSLTVQEVYPKIYMCVTKFEIFIGLNTNKITNKRKNLQKKSLELSKLKFFRKHFVSESMSFENHQLSYKCRKSKNLGKSFQLDSTTILST